VTFVTVLLAATEQHEGAQEVQSHEIKDSGGNYFSAYPGTSDTADRSGPE
jgi:hypothetical protein